MTEGLHYPDEREQRIMDGMAEAFAAADGCPLDAAWAEAEAALPEGWCDLMVYHYDPPPGDVHVPGNYGAKTLEPGTGAETYGYGSTPAAALRALAAKLRERP